MGKSSSKFQNEPREIIIGNSEQNEKTFIKNYISTTRYNLITFLPKAIFLQFTRYANIYFLFMAILQMIPAISPLSPISSVAPLVFVISLSVIREGLEDYNRYRSDIELNSNPCTKYRNGKWIKSKWMNVFVGDLIKVTKEEFFPADLILLASSDPTGNAFIQTSSLDGEKNLKPRICFKRPQELIGDASMIRLVGKLNLPPPNSDLYDASGQLLIGGEDPLIISTKQFMLRGSILKNTNWVVGVVGYTGPQTKIMMNAEDSRIKQSQVEKTTNILILFIFLLQVIFCVTIGILNFFWSTKWSDKLDPLIVKRYEPHWEGLFTVGTMLVLTNTMIPISLIISLEMVKLIQARFINIDEDLYNSENERFAKVQSSSLNEELGQIEFIFSDKTGTLTCNKMEFKMCMVGNMLYGDSTGIEVNQGDAGPAIGMQVPGGPTFVEPRFDNLSKGIPNDEAINLQMKYFDTGEIGYTYKTQYDLVKEYFLLLAVCHDCILEKDETGSSYQGESPDEIALVATAKEMGYQYTGPSPGYKNLEVFGEQFKVEEVVFFPFTSTRKRASIIIKHENVYKIMIKGADSFIIDRLAPESDTPQPYLSKTEGYLSKFSKVGLRTLCMAVRIISESEINKILEEYRKAQLSPDKDKLVGKYFSTLFIFIPSL